MTELSYRYLTPSAVSNGAGRVSLDFATSGGSDPSHPELAHPFFFAGFVERPAVVAQSLLVLARISRTRFYVPPNTLAAEIRAADPVVTTTPEGLRFEAFSVCCGVYARLDLDADAFEAEHLARGVTRSVADNALREWLQGFCGSSASARAAGHLLDIKAGHQINREASK